MYESPIDLLNKFYVGIRAYENMKLIVNNFLKVYTEYKAIVTKFVLVFSGLHNMFSFLIYMYMCSWMFKGVI